MNKILVKLFTLLVAVLFSSQLSAQNPIPSYNVPVISDPTIFEEIPDSKLSYSFLSKNASEVLMSPINAEERTIYIKAEKKVSKEYAWATYIVYSLDGFSTYGPFTIYEGEIQSSSIDMRLWGVRVVEASTDIILSVWIE